MLCPACGSALAIAAHGVSGAAAARHGTAW